PALALDIGRGIWWPSALARGAEWGARRQSGLCRPGLYTVDVNQASRLISIQTLDDIKVVGSESSNERVENGIPNPGDRRRHQLVACRPVLVRSCCCDNGQHLRDQEHVVVGDLRLGRPGRFGAAA